MNAFPEHSIHILGGIALLGGLIFGLVGVLVFLDRRGNMPRAKGHGNPPGRNGRKGGKKPGRAASRQQRRSKNSYR